MQKSVNLVIFAYRETFEELDKTIRSAIDALPAGSIVDVIINGGSRLENLKHQQFPKMPIPEYLELNIWSIPVADKGNAWNQHIHHIWRQGYDAIYIDGYVRINKRGIQSLSATLHTGLALGSSGLPSIGWGARNLASAMLENGGFHGNFCAITSRAIETMRIKGIRIPMGMYRVDSIMGAFLSFGLDNALNSWSPHEFVPISIDATWEVDKKKWYRLKDIASWLRRRERQAQGDIENLAVRYHLVDLKTRLEELPLDIKEIVVEWSRSRPLEADATFNKSPRHAAAKERLFNYTSPDINGCAAEKIFCSRA